MKKIYSEKIREFIEKENWILLIPDLILVKEGIACGDRIVISGEIDNEKLLFSFSASNACSLCNVMCSYLQMNFNDRKLNETLDMVTTLYNDILNDNSYIFNLFDLNEKQYNQRFDCLISPIKLLITFIEELKTTTYKFGDKPDTHNNMECDACVGTCRINWANQKTEKLDHHGSKDYSTEYLKKWLPLGKIILNDEDKKLLKEVCKEMTEEDHKFLSDHTMNSFVLHHLINNYPELLDEKWKAAAYLIQKNEITLKYFEEVKEYIINRGLDIYFVKGYVSQKYYENPSLRIHSDYDLIATNSNDAFRLTNYLLRNGFTIRPNLFSFKKMLYEGKEVISGHFHVQKIIDDTYMFELDITFPGFPINRLELFYPKVKNNEISLEDQIVVTTLHLFKHSNIYMKDINDIYYMTKEKLDIFYLKEMLKKHNLMEFFGLAIMYIYNNYPYNENIKKIIEEFNFNNNILNEYQGWPYDRKMHLKIKQKDFNNRIQKKQEFERNYLYPVVIFKEEYDFSKINIPENSRFDLVKLLDTIYEVKYGNYIFYLTTIGIFIDNYIDTTSVSRRKFLEILNNFLKIIDYKEFYPIPYATEHFYVRVI